MGKRSVQKETHWRGVVARFERTRSIRPVRQRGRQLLGRGGTVRLRTSLDVCRCSRAVARPLGNGAPASWGEPCPGSGTILT